MLGHYIANFVMFPPRHSSEETEQIDTERGFGDAFKDYHNLWDRHSFTIDSDDATISGEYVINPLDNGVRKKVIIISHGTTSIREADVKYGKLFYDYGFNLIIFDHRYFGKSKAPYCTLGEKESEDIKKIVAYAREVFGKEAIIGIHGESMGAAAAVKCLDTEEPTFVIADCPFCNLELLLHDIAYKKALFAGLIATKIARRIGLRRYNYDYTLVKPIESLKESKVPICFMHGGKDKLIDKKHSEALLSESKSPLSELHVFKNADHAMSIVSEPENYKSILYAFIDKVIK